MKMTKIGGFYMKNKAFKFICIALAVMFAFTVSLSARGQQDEAVKGLPVVGISTGSSGTSWRDIMIDALEEVGDEYKAAGKIANYKLVNNVTNGDATEQANILRDFISQGVDIILVNPNSPDSLNGVIKEAQEEDILVVSFDATVTAPDVLNVTLDHYAWMLKKHLKIPPSAGLIYNLDIEKGFKKVTLFTEESAGEVISTSIRFLKQYSSMLREGRFPKKEKPQNCRNCPYKFVCENFEGQE